MSHFIKFISSAFITLLRNNTSLLNKPKINNKHKSVSPTRGIIVL